MINLLHGATTDLIFDFPSHWPIDATSVEVAVYNSSGTAVLAATAATVASSTTLDGATTRGDKSITTDATTGMSGGVILGIAESSSGPREDVEISYVDSSNKEVYLQDRLEFAHKDENGVFYFDN